MLYEVITLGTAHTATMFYRKVADNQWNAFTFVDGQNVVITSYSIHYTKLYDTDPPRPKDAHRLARSVQCAR